MKAVSKKWTPETELSTPYQRAKQVWDERMGGAVMSAKHWRMCAFSAIVFIAFPCVIGMIILGLQPKVVPHIVDVLPDGSAHYRGTTGQSWKDYKPTEASIIYHLHRFIEDIRVLSSDPAVIKRSWIDAYNLVTANAKNTLDVYAKEMNPFERASKERVNIEIISTIPLSKDSWQIDWKERTWGTKGQLIKTLLWRGVFKIRLVQHQSEMALVNNPLGMYIDEFHWTKVKG